MYDQVYASAIRLIESIMETADQFNEGVPEKGRINLSAAAQLAQDMGYL